MTVRRVQPARNPREEVLQDLKKERKVCTVTVHAVKFDKKTSDGPSIHYSQKSVSLGLPIATIYCKMMCSIVISFRR